MSDTIFTKIIAREIPADIVFEDDEIIAFRDINPLAPIHILVIPKKHIPTINDMEVDDQILIGKIVFTAKNLAKKFGIDESGYRLIFNCNKDGGQHVPHIHCHLIGGKRLSWTA
jgi:histidine triad (HIT) family protein